MADPKQIISRRGSRTIRERDRFSNACHVFFTVRFKWPLSLMLPLFKGRTEPTAPTQFRLRLKNGTRSSSLQFSLYCYGIVQALPDMPLNTTAGRQRPSESN